MSTFRDQQVEEAAQLARRMRMLKWVVLILGILLVLAMVTTVAGVIYKARHAAPACTQSGALGTATIPGTIAGTIPGGFGAASLPVPAACQVASATASGDRLIVVTSGPSDQCRLILVADLKSGRLIGRFTFQAP
ncbi:MAG TPA: hypothetical protein VM639_00715 [Dongiaceae bacterium]|nr:hypothetical protein [Dongiaceae bacterium]